MSQGSDLTCPQCSAPLDVKYLGQMKDKILFCSHCGYKKDLPDEYEMKRKEVEKTKHGSKTVELSYRRKDMHGDSPDPATKGKTGTEDSPYEVVDDYEVELDPSMPGAHKEIMDLTRKAAQGEIPASELSERMAELGLKPTHGGKSWVKTKAGENVQVTTWSSDQMGEAGAKEAMEKALGSLPEAFRDLADGKEHTLTHRVSEDKTYHFGGRDSRDGGGTGITLQISSSNVLVLAMVVVILVLGVILLLLL